MKKLSRWPFRSRTLTRVLAEARGPRRRLRGRLSTPCSTVDNYDISVDLMPRDRADRSSNSPRNTPMTVKMPERDHRSEVKRKARPFGLPQNRSNAAAFSIPSHLTQAQHHLRGHKPKTKKHIIIKAHQHHHNAIQSPREPPRLPPRGPISRRATDT